MVVNRYGGTGAVAAPVNCQTGGCADVNDRLKYLRAVRYLSLT